MRWHHLGDRLTDRLTTARQKRERVSSKWYFLSEQKYSANIAIYFCSFCKRFQLRQVILVIYWYIFWSGVACAGLQKQSEGWKLTGGRGKTGVNLSCQLSEFKQNADLQREHKRLEKKNKHLTFQNQTQSRTAKYRSLSHLQTLS